MIEGAAVKRHDISVDAMSDGAYLMAGVVGAVLLLVTVAALLSIVMW